MIPRRTPLKRGGPIARSGPPKRVNRERKVSAFKHAYFSRARVAFVGSLCCAACGQGPCDNAHTESGGMGRKAHYTTIAPLCTGINGCHRIQHQRGWMAIAMTEESRRRAADLTQTLWREHLTRSTTEEDDAPQTEEV